MSELCAASPLTNNKGEKIMKNPNSFSDNFEKAIRSGNSEEMRIHLLTFIASFLLMQRMKNDCNISNDSKIMFFKENVKIVCEVSDMFKRIAKEFIINNKGE